MDKQQTAMEFGKHLAALVTPKDSTRYAQILKDNEAFIAREVEAHVQHRCKGLVEALEHFASCECDDELGFWQLNGELETRDGQHIYEASGTFKETAGVARAALATFNQPNQDGGK